MAETPSWLSQYTEVKDDSWLDQYKEVKEKPFLDISETASALGRAATSLPTTTMASLSQAWEGLDNPWKRSEGYLARRQEMQALQDELAKEEEEAAASGDISTVSSTIREATPSLGFSGATLIPSMGAAAGTLALSKSPMAARGAAAATSALMAYRMASAQFLDDAKDRIDSFFAENLNREPTEQEKEEAYQELLPLARKFGAAEAGPEALGNLALGGAGKYIRRALGGKNGVMELASNALGKVTGTKAALAGAGALTSEIGTEAVTGVEQQRIQKQFEEGVMRGESPESVPLEERTLDDYIKSFKEVAPATIAMTGMMGAAGLGPTAIARGIKALRPTPPERQTQIQKDLQAEAGAIPQDAVPDQTNEEKLAAMEAGGTTVVDPDGKTAVIPPQQPELPSMPSPDEVAVQLNTDAAKSLEAAGSSESAKAQAGFDATLKEILPKTSQPTVQPEQAAEEVALEVTPLSEGVEENPVEIHKKRNAVAESLIVRDAEGGVNRAETRKKVKEAAEKAGLTVDEFADAQAAANIKANEDFFNALNEGDVLEWTDANGRKETGRVEVGLNGKKTVRNTTEGSSAQDYQYTSKSGIFSQVADTLKVIRKNQKSDSQPQPVETQEDAAREMSGKSLVSSPTNELSDSIIDASSAGVSVVDKHVAIPAQSPQVGFRVIRPDLIDVVDSEKARKVNPTVLASYFPNAPQSGNITTDGIVKLARKSLGNSNARFRAESSIPAGVTLEAISSLTAYLAGKSRDALGRAIIFLPTGDLGKKGLSAGLTFTFNGASLEPTGLGTVYLPLSGPTVFPLELLSANRATIQNFLSHVDIDVTKETKNNKDYANNSESFQESVRQKPQDRIEGRKAKEASLGDRLLRPAEGEVKEEVMPLPEVAADPFAAAPLVDNLPALIAVRDNNATPEQVQSLVDQGLVEQVDGQNIITEAGVAAMPEDQRPKLTPTERAAEIEGMGVPVFTRNEIIVSKPSVSRRSRPNGVDGESITEIKAPSKVTSPDNWNRLGDIEKLDATVEARLDFATGKAPKKTDKSWTAFAGRKTKAGRSVLARNVTYNEAIEAAKDFVESANFQPQPTAAEKPTPDSVAVEPGATRGVQAEPVGGSIPTVGEVSPETEISSRENLGPKAAAAKKKQAAADEAAKKRQKKQDESTKNSLNSILDPQKKNAVTGTVTKADVETAREALTNSGEIPNAYLTNVYESLEAFLADKANARLFPSAYARLQTEKNIEGLYENGQTLIFAKQIQVSNLDRNLAKMLGIKPEQAAARRVIAHENGHKAISLFTMAEKRELRGYLMRAYSDEQIAKLVETYDEYADWRTNLESRFEALEELLMRDFEKMDKIPTGGVWDDIVQFLKRVWRRLTGQKGEPTLKNLKDVARLMRNAMKRPAVALGSFTLKDGGKVKLSAIAPTAGITPEMDAEYLAAVEAGDMEKAQALVDEAAKKAGFDTKAFHVTSAPTFNVFDPDLSYDAGFWFTTDKKSIERGETGASISGISRIIEAWVKLGKVAGWDEYEKSTPSGLARQGFNSAILDKDIVVFNPSQIKSADPVTYDDNGNVIPLSQRFQPTSPDIRFSRPQFASDTDAATSAGNEAARSTIYSERDMDVREAIRRAYEAMPKDTSVAVPIGELFAKTEEMLPDVTQDEFSNVLQDLFEDNGAVLQEGEQIIPEQEVEIQAFEKDNPFNELIRKSSEKSPSLSEINGVSKKFIQRVLRPTSSFAANNGIRVDDNAPLQARAMPDGSIIIGYSLPQERFDELQKMAPQAASQYTKDSVIEELIHVSDLIGLRNQWIKSGKKISFDQFVFGEQSNLAFSLIQKADSLNDSETESLRRILASSLSLYNNNPEIANLGLNELLDLAAQYPYVLPDLVRSLIQLKKTGQLTETAFRKIANVLREWQEIILQWISDGYASAKEGVFVEMLSERIKNAENNLAQLSDTSEINVTTPEGRRAGFVVVMPRAAKASKIPIDEIKEASKPFKEDLIEASKGREEKAAFKGNVMRGNVVPDHNVNATELYKKAANDLLDSLLKNHDILDVAESVQDPDLQAELGMQIGGVVQPEDILNVRQYLGALLQRRLTVAISSEKNPKRLRQLEMARRSINAYSDGASGGGTALNNAKQVQNDPELKGDFFFSQATREKAQKAKDKLDAITGGTEKITDIITGAEQKAAEETTQAEVEAQESAVEDDEYAKLVSEGEEGLEGRRKTIWERAKMILRRLAMYARADKLDIKEGSKASLSAEQRKELDELNAILRMPKAERDKAREKDLAEFDALMTEFLGLESEAKTPEQKKTRQKRVKMIDVVRKYAESGKFIDLADQQTALKGMLREMNKARPADSVPLERAMPWRKILSSNPKDVAEYRQRIFEAISDLPSFQNLTDEQKERLADLYAEAWENRKQAILDRMLRDEIKKARDRDEISEDVEKKLQQSRNKILEIVNLGGFNNDDLVKVLGERYGISTSFTEEQKERIQKLADQLQDEDMNTAKRNKLAMEFAVELAGAMDVPVSEIISNWWTSSVLFGPQTIFSIGAAFLNGGYSIATIGTRRMLAKLFKGDIQGAIEESILMLKGFARYLGAFKQSGRRAWNYLWTGDVGLLGTGSTDILSEINNFDQLQRFQRHKLLAEQLAKDPRMVRRYVGVYLRFVSRLLTALDAFNVMVTKAGTASLALRMSGMSTDKIIEAEKMLNLKTYKEQVIRDYFDNKAPKTQAEKALVDSYAEAEMYRAINKLGGKMENADYLASESAMTMHPTGFGGVVYDAITGFFAQRQSNADEYLEKMKKDWISNKDLKAVTFLALAYLRQFAAYNAAGLTGSKFVRYASNKFNQGLSFIPFAGLLRQIEAKDDRIKGKDAFRETIYRNQIVSFVMLMVGYSVIKAIQDEPDDEERGNFWNGGWANLTPDQKKQMLAKGQKEYTMGFKFNGRWYVFNYQNWPLNQILSAIGSMSDQIRFSPEKWDEKSALSKGVAGMVSGVKSTLEIPALSGLQELVGNRLASKDPTEKDLDRLSRVASGWVGGFVPRILKDIDFYTQPELRKYEGLWEKTASHIPIYRRYVGEEYYDILGKQIKRNVIPGSREFMMGPTEPEYKILGALNARNIFLTPANAEYRMVGKGRNRRRLTQEEADAYSLETGRGYRDMLLRYGQRALQMPTERARAFLQDKAEEVRDRALKRAYRR